MVFRATRLAVGLLAIGPFCASHSYAEEDPDRVPLVAVLASPERYEGRLIRTFGFAVFDLEDQSLYLSAADARHQIRVNSLWLELPQDEGAMGRFSNRYVVVQGRLDAKRRGHLGLSRGTLTKISGIEVMPHTGESRLPSVN